MSTQPFEEFDPEELAALRAIVQERIQEEMEDERRHAPFDHTYNVEVERLREKGIEVSRNRFCWLRLRFHQYNGYYMSGSPSYGYSWYLCTDCGHSKKAMCIGGAIVMIG